MARTHPTTKTAPVPPVGSLLERFKDFPAIDVIERRFQNPNDPGSLPILLKDESPHACCNTEHHNRIKGGWTTCQVKSKDTGRACGKPLRKWFVYWVNTAKEGRWSQIKSKGYVPVEVRDLQDAQEVSDLVKQTEESGSIYVRRGDRGQEILCKQPLELYNEIKKRQRAATEARNKSVKSRREERAEMAGKELGDEAGQAIYDGEIKEEYMRRGKSTLQEEAAGDDE